MRCGVRCEMWDIGCGMCFYEIYDLKFEPWKNVDTCMNGQYLPTDALFPPFVPILLKPLLSSLTFCSLLHLS